MKDPSFPLYARDWLTETCTMSLPARAVLMDLMCQQWLHGPLPDDPHKLRKMCAADKDEFDAVWPEVQERLVKTSGFGWVNERLEEVRQERAAYLERQRANGALGGRPPSKTQDKPKQNPVVTSGLTQTEPKHNLASASASASALSSSIATADIPLTPKGELGEAFNEWIAYKKEKGQAYKPKGLAALIKRLERMPDPIGAIQHSMAMNYTGVYPEKPHTNGKAIKETIYEKAVRLGGV